MVFVSLVEGISQCEAAGGRRRSGPLATSLDFPYHPHVTVAHDLPDAQLDRAFEDLATFECEFDVTDFHLYVHDSEARLATDAGIPARQCQESRGA